jgi:hypothetical protein
VFSLADSRKVSVFDFGDEGHADDDDAKTLGEQDLDFKIPFLK